MRYPTVIADYMRETSCAVAASDSVHSAKQWLDEHGVGEVPVCEGGHCCGILTQRDMDLAERGLECKTDLLVRDVMNEDFYPVMPSTPLAHVVTTMATHGYHHAVVIEHGEVRGVFTVVHALRALVDVLGQQEATRDGLGPGDVRSVILTEHLHVRSLLSRARVAADAVRGLDDAGHDLSRLRAAMERLLTAMSAHVDLEDRALAPALASLPGYGNEWVEQLVQEHRRQTAETQQMVQKLEVLDRPGQLLARELDDLMGRLEADLSNEEVLLLNPDLLRNDGIVTECTAG